MIAVENLPAQSVLSLQYPLGLPVNPSSGMAVSMGGAGVGVSVPNNVMLENPANLGTIDQTAFSSFISFDFLQINDDGRNTEHVRVVPEQVSFSFPLDFIGTIGFGVLNQTDASVKFQTPSRDLGNNLEGQLGYDREGGLTSWQLGWGRNLDRWVHLGIAYQRLYLNIKSTAIQEIPELSQAAARDSAHLSFRGNGIRLGILVPLGNLTAGMSWNYVFEGTADIDSITRLSSDNSSVANSDTTFEQDFNLPSTFTVGASYRFNSQWLAAIDVSMTQWNQFEGGGPVKGPERDNTVELSLGGQFIPSPDELQPQYWETIRYRAGFRYNQLPDENSTNFAITLGTGLPLRAGGLLDIVAEFGRRTDDSYSDYSENYVLLGIGVNGGRNWRKASESNF